MVSVVSPSSWKSYESCLTRGATGSNASLAPAALDPRSPHGRLWIRAGSTARERSCTSTRSTSSRGRSRRQDGEVRLRHRLRPGPAARREEAVALGRGRRPAHHGARRRPHAAASRRQRGSARPRRAAGVDRRSVRLLRRPVGLLRQDARRPEPQGLGHLQGPRADAQDRPADRADLHAEHRRRRLVEDAAAVLGRLQPRPPPVPGGKLAFVSDRNAFKATNPGYAPNALALQLFVMDDDGSNVECIGHLNLGMALHPVILQGWPDHVQLAGIAGAAQPSPVGHLVDPSRRHQLGPAASAPSTSATAPPTPSTSRRSSPTGASSSSRTTTSTTSASARTSSCPSQPPDGYPPFGPGYHERPAQRRRCATAATATAGPRCSASRSARTASRR